jgi:hypothetical protein
MDLRIHRWVWDKLTDWLAREHPDESDHLSDYNRLRYEIRPADVLLVEGRSHVSDIIKIITLSSWTHSALYIGRIHDVEDPATRRYIMDYLDYEPDPAEPLVIEALLGKGTVISPLSNYEGYHLRICRPKGISLQDGISVIRHAASRLGTDYDVRQILDLARFMFPYGILPGTWRSSLFEHNFGGPTRTVCSSMLAKAFHSVHFPILPVLAEDANGNMKLLKRNHKLYTPKDFDYSPYFDIIKYPMLNFDELEIYRHLPWDTDGLADTTQINPRELERNLKNGGIATSNNVIHVDPAEKKHQVSED